MTENRYEKFGSLERERTLHQSKVQTDLTRDIVELGQELERGKLSEHQAIRILKNMYDHEMDERKLTYDMLNKIINH